MLAFHVDHVKEIIQGVERGGLGDVVDEKESIGSQIRCCPQAAILFLARCVCEGEKVGSAIYCASDGVGILLAFVLVVDMMYVTIENTYCRIISEKCAISVQLSHLSDVTRLTHVSTDFEPAVM